MITLYKYALKNLGHKNNMETWPERYKDICKRVRAVKNWTNSADASDELIDEMIHVDHNGVSYAGRAIMHLPNPRPSYSVYRRMLQQLKEGLQAKLPSDEVLRCRAEFIRITGRRTNSIFNRIVSAFLPGEVSPVMSEDDFNDACNKLVQAGFIEPVFLRAGDDPWHAKNVQLMKQLKTLLPDGPVEGARWAIDDYTRGIFVWAVHMMDMDNWLIVRKQLEGEKR